jgi:hypothetical protein
VAAGPAGATLAMGGTGFQLFGHTGTGKTFLTSAGGGFVNTGLLVHPASGSNFSGIRAAVVQNQGHVVIEPSFELVEGGVLKNEPGGLVELRNGGGVVGNGRLENAGLLWRSGGDTHSRLFGLLRSLPGSEIRSDANRLDLDSPASRSVPAGVTLTGTGRFLFPPDLEHEGTISPGAEEQPIATLTLMNYFRPSLVAGSPQLIIDVDENGQSDRLDVLFAPGPPNVRLGGALIIRVRPGYVPQLGDEFTILTSARDIAGQFGQIAVDGAPEGIAFVSELSDNLRSVIVRAVEVAPDGPVSVSHTSPIGGADRSIFLTGPGAGGITSARLECTDCLDSEAYGLIPSTLTGEGTIKEARFDLTSPRAMGYYDLVIVRPGRENVVVPVTVRPFLGYVIAEGGLSRGARVRPAGMGYNYSVWQMGVRTNHDAPAFAIPRIKRPSPEQFSLALASPNPFWQGVVYFESDLATDPLRAPLAFGRIIPGETTALTMGLRIDPEQVLFPEQTPTGPDDPRVPFGEGRRLDASGAQHLTFQRAANAFAHSLRNSASGGLTNYVASVDAADPLAVQNALVNVFQIRRRAYFTSPSDILGIVVDELNQTVSAPSGLATSAADAFELAVDDAVDNLYESIEVAHFEALHASSPGVAALFDLESSALFPGGFPERAAGARSARSNLNLWERFLCSMGFGPSIKAVNNQTIDPFGDGDGDGGGGESCSPPEAPADPNDKLAENNLMCEFGIVIVDGEEQTRCVRYFVPLEQATEPLFYTITFENLPEATANAEFVTIFDEIDPNLNLATLEILGTSSDSTFSYDVTGRTVSFQFVGIDLPPNVTAPEGEGYVKFSIRPNAGLEEGTEIRNEASIVFDFNPPIETPEVVHEIRSAADVAALVVAPIEVELGSAALFQVSAGNLRGDVAGDVTLTIVPPDAPVVSITTPKGECSDGNPIVCELGDMAMGEFVTVDIVVQAEMAGPISVTAIAATTAFDGFLPNNTDGATVMVVVVSSEDDGVFPRELTLAQPYPNPTRGAAVLRWGLPQAGPVHVRIYDLLGREVARLAEGDTMAAGWHEMQWDARLAAGAYIIRLSTGSAAVSRRVIVVR